MSIGLIALMVGVNTPFDRMPATFMRLLLTITIVSAALLSATPVKKKKASTPHSTVAKWRAPHSAARSRPAIAKASTQGVPSSDRYKEIQDALTAKGYLKTPASGVWDQDSQEAMRRFQADQNLDVTGKLSARTLISLGLGPK